MPDTADFLGTQAPFDGLDDADLDRLVARAEVVYADAGDVVVPAGAGRLEHLWVVRSGSLEVRDDGRVVDLLGPGDTFGDVTLMARLPPGLEVRAPEDSVCLRIPDPRGYVAHPESLRFGTVDARSRRERLVRADLGAADRRLAHVMRPIVRCHATDRIRDVADRIGAAGLSCALVDTGAGLGIVTDHDFRSRVATGQVPPDAPVGALATVPARAVDEDATPAAGLLAMVEHGVHHLVVTDRAGRATGVVRAVDLAHAEVRDPLLIRAAVDAAGTLDELVTAARMLPGTIGGLHDGGVAAVRIGAVHATIVEAIVRRALHLRRHGVLGRVRHSWVLLGSLARHEPLPYSDLDTALVWADDADLPPGGAEAVRAAARDVLTDLRRCGLEPCADGVNADNPQFSRSRSSWVAAARGWQHDPTMDALLLSAMVTDSRPLTDGTLGRSLTDTMRSPTRTSQFLRAMLSEALGWRPPVGFVRDFVVHHTGENRGRLDLKAGGLAPVVSLARWVAVVTGDTLGTTPERLRRGAESGLLGADEAGTLAGAFSDVYSLLMDHQVRAMRSGDALSAYLDPKTLDTLTRRHLRESFRAVSAVQNRIDADWHYRLDRMVSRAG